MLTVICSSTSKTAKIIKGDITYITLPKSQCAAKSKSRDLEHRPLYSRPTRRFTQTNVT